jgi:hypothetical protein
MSALVDAPAGTERRAIAVQEFGELEPISRFGGQGRVYRPAVVPAGLGDGPVVVKVYRRAPPAGAGSVLAEMVAWSHLLEPEQRAALYRVAAWPLAVVRAGEVAAGIAMRDVRGRFSVPFAMPSGRREQVLLTLEHLLGADSFLQMRGLGVTLDTFTRTEVAERICDALAFLHRHAIVASDIAPNNLLVAFGAGDEPEVCFIDCDSMVFLGRQALTSVQTADWDIPAAFDASPNTRAADAYKLGLVVLRLFARSHDARALGPHARHVPAELHGLVARALAGDAVNRPPAGEWQRALRGLLADGRLNERYPGPAPAPRVVVRAVPPVTPGASTGATPGATPGVAPAPGASTGARPAGTVRLISPGLAQRAGAAASQFGRPVARAVPQAQLTGSVWLRRAVVVAWIVAGTAVLLLLFSRLFAGAIPVPEGGNSGAGSTFGPGTTSQYLYQGYPRREILPQYPGFSQVP